MGYAEDADQCIRCGRWISYNDESVVDGYSVGEVIDDQYVCARCITMGEETAVREQESAFLKEMGFSQSDPAFEDNEGSA